MKKELLSGIIQVASVGILFCLASGLTIQTHPFKFHLHDWKRTLLITIILVCVFLLAHFSFRKGLMAGYDDCIEMIHEMQESHDKADDSERAD